MSKTGVLLALAFPEEFVAMIPAWYKKPLEWMGLINDEMICAGHSALALINAETGKIEYADFGRYITPFGKGRTRTEITDPECLIEVIAKFDKAGKITNEEEILIYLEAHPDKTHGAGKMYGSFCYGINYTKAQKFIKNIPGMHHQFGTCLNQGVGTDAFKRVNVSGDGKHLPILLGG